MKGLSFLSNYSRKFIPFILGRWACDAEAVGAFRTFTKERDGLIGAITIPP